MRVAIKIHWFDWINRQEAFVFILLLIAILFLGLTTTTFLTQNNIQDISRNFAWIAIPAFGESLVIIIGGIDLSVGAVMALSGLVTAMALRFGVSIPMAIISGLAAGSLIGWVNGALVGSRPFSPIYRHSRNGQYRSRHYIWNCRRLADPGSSIGLPGSWPGGYPSGTILSPCFNFNNVAFSSSGRYVVERYCSGTVYLHTRRQRTSFDRDWRGTPANLKAIVYTLCGTLTAAGGILMTAQLGVAAPTAATGYELDIIAAVIIGGTSLFGGVGSILGVLLGAAFSKWYKTALFYWVFRLIGNQRRLAQ